MLVSLTVGKVDAGVTVLLTPDKRLIEFPSILLPPDIASGSIVDITVSRNVASEQTAERAFSTLQEQIYARFGAREPLHPVLRCRNATQTSVVLEWDPIELATADLLGLSLYRNGSKVGTIPRPLAMHSTKISGLAVDTHYDFHLVLRTTAGTWSSDRVGVRTHKMTDLSGVTITPGILSPPQLRDHLARAVDRIGARIADAVRIDTTHFVTTEGRGVAWEKAVEMNIPVVRPEWVSACEQAGRILGVTKFYLDAQRTGPPMQDFPSPPPPPTPPPAPAKAEAASPPGQQQQQKYVPSQLPGTPGANGGGEASEKPAEVSSEEEEDDDDDEDPTLQAAADKDKAKSPAPVAEQKVRLDDEQKLALRPSVGAAEKKKDDAQDDDDEDEDSVDELPTKAKTQGKGKDVERPGPSPGDASSFQDVAL